MLESPHTDKTAAWTFTGLWIPAEVILSDELTSTDKLIFGIVQNLAYSEVGCWASNNFIGVRARISKQSVSKSISKLIELNFLIAQFTVDEFRGTTRYLKVPCDLMTKLQTETIAKLSKSNKNEGGGGSSKILPPYYSTTTKTIIENTIENKKRTSEREKPALDVCSGESFGRSKRTLFNKINTNPSTIEENVIAAFFEDFKYYRHEVHPPLSDQQITAGLEAIKKYIIDNDLEDEDCLVDFFRLHFRKQVFHEQGYDFRFPLFVANLEYYTQIVQERYK